MQPGGPRLRTPAITIVIGKSWQFSELWHFIFVTSRLVTANVSPQLFWKSLCHQRLTNIQYSRYVYGTPNLSPFCMADSPNLAKSCSLAILAAQYSLLL
jgi:hypothetical protein